MVFLPVRQLKTLCEPVNGLICELGNIFLIPCFIGIFFLLRAEFRKVFFAVITPNSAHFAGKHSVALDMQDLEPLFTLYSTLQLCATLCRHFTGTLIIFYKKTPLKPFNCTILHNPAKCETPLYNTQPLIYKGFNIYM